MDFGRKVMLGLAAAAILVLIGTALFTGNVAIYLLAALAVFPALLVWRRRGVSD